MAEPGLVDSTGPGCGVRGAGCGVRGAGCGVRGAGCGVRGAGCGVPGRGSDGVCGKQGVPGSVGFCREK